MQKLCIVAPEITQKLFITMKQIALSGVFGWEITAGNLSESLSGLSEDVSLLLNTAGGSVVEGIAIVGVIESYKKRGYRVTGCIEGICASMGTLVATVLDSVSMLRGSLMMVHYPRGLAYGDYLSLSKVSEELRAVSADFLTYYKRRTGLDEKVLTAMLQAETWLTADQAKELGFVDEIVEPTIKGPGMKTPEELLAEVEEQKAIVAEQAAKIEAANRESYAREDAAFFDKLVAEGRVMTTQRDSIIGSLAAARESGAEVYEKIRLTFAGFPVHALMQDNQYQPGSLPLDASVRVGFPREMLASISTESLEIHKRILAMSSKTGMSYEECATILLEKV